MATGIGILAEVEVTLSDTGSEVAAASDIETSR